jgi:hypothetical protein
MMLVGSASATGLLRATGLACGSGLALRHQAIRHISEEQLGADADAVADLFQRNLLHASRKKPEHGRPPILTTRREALALYREVLRYSNLFVWKDERGRMWRDVIRDSTRKEYEAARFEPDPEIINKLIITGRDCVQRTMETFGSKRRQIIEEEAASQHQGGRPL